MAVAREALVDLLSKHEGKMKKSDFVSEFKSLLESDDPEERRRRRESFKALVNQVACVKDQNGVQHVVLKKVRRPLLDGGPAEDEEVKERGVSARGGERQKKPQLQSHTVEEAPPASPREAPLCGEEPEVLSPVQQVLQKSTFGEFKVRRTLSFDVQKRAKSSSVPRKPDDTSGPRSVVEVHTVGTQPATNSDPTASLKVSDKNSSSHRRSHPPPPPPPSPPPPSHLSAESALTPEPSSDNRVPSAVPLDPGEHQWLVQCAAGRWNHVLGLLMQDIQLAAKKDFMSGFTALHWAAKRGDSRMLLTILDMARREGVDLDVDARSHGGYTPLHIATLHGQDYIVTMLVSECGASVGARDHSGRQAHHYLRSGATASLREMLAQPRVSPQEQMLLQQQQQREEQQVLPPELSRGRLHSISRLFQPHTVAHRRKHKKRPTDCSSTSVSYGEDPAVCPAEEQPQNNGTDSVS